MTRSSYLVCTDLDRTLIPNGLQEESALARPLFERLMNSEDITLAYVSGRDLGLVEQAIEEWSLPTPDYIIADVGSSLYRNTRQGWHMDSNWSTHIGEDWSGLTAADLHALLNPEALTLQDADRQKAFKLCYETRAEQLETATQKVQKTLDAKAIKARCISSIDETENLGLLDILPLRAGKRQAILFLSEQLDIPHARTHFSGDSGNDIDALAAPFNGTLVANATAPVRVNAFDAAKQEGHASQFYQARGLPELELNGHYAAGIVEGLLHFFPEFSKRL